LKEIKNIFIKLNCHLENQGNKMKYLIIFICLLASIANSNSQDMNNLNERAYPFHYVGATISTLSAPGVSYKIYLNPRIGFKLTGYIYNDDNEHNYNGNMEDPIYNDTYVDNQLIYMIGGEFHYVIINTRNSRFYSLAGVGYFYNNNENTNYEYNTNNRHLYEDLDSRFTTGAGFGFEISLWDHIVFDIQGCLQYVDEKNQNYNNGNLVDDDFGRGINIGGGAGIYFKF
jgi:hypothetical protein